MQTKTNQQFIKIMTCILFFFIASQLAHADVPKMIHFQGFLTDENGTAVEDGTYTITFSLWDGDNESQANNL